MAEDNNVTYVFGEFSLDPSLRTFSKNGELLHLPAKEFDTLEYLLRNHGRVLTKAELMTAIWDDTFVEEGNLAQYVSRLRKILDTNGGNHIQTLPKKGYRFDADIKVVKIGPAHRRRSTWLVGVGVISAIGLMIVLAWLFFYRARPEAVVEQTADAPVALTDGRQDDGAVEWTSDNHIRFFRRVSPKRFESWVMNTDGSDQHREQPAIKDFLNGKWSPDGKRVHFMKDGDSEATYLARSDGSEEVKLPLLVGNSDWSPDGTSIVYETVVNNNAEIFLYTVATRQNIDLTNSPDFDADPSFSPDGRSIAFLSSRDGNAEIYTMDTNGQNIRRLTDHPAFDNFPAISPDGTQIAFVSNRIGETGYLFLKNLSDDLPPLLLSDLSGIQGITPKCWSADGTQLVVTSDQNGKDQIFLINVEPYKPKVILSDEKADLQFPRVSPDGARIIYQARLADHSIELRVTDIISKTTNVVFRTGADLTPTYLLSPAWSPDNARIVFSSISQGNSDIYSADADGTGLQKLTDDPLADLSPVFSADGTEIFFVRDAYGKTALYRMGSDGTNAHPITGKGVYEMSPAVSPDGKTLLFSADRVDGMSKGLDIFKMDPSDPGNEKILLSRPNHDVMATFSPDGKEIVFVAESDGNQEIYVMNGDGSDLRRLTRNKAVDYAPVFSGDSRTVFFSSNRAGKYAIYQVDLPY